MTQNIESRTEVAVKKYEGASNVVDKIAQTDADVETGVGKRKSFPKISREWNDESQRLQTEWKNDSGVIREDWQNERNELSTKALGVKPWEAGQSETNINQQRRWTDNHTYLPKSVPVVMDAAGPNDDWIPYTADKSDTLNDVFGRKPVDLIVGSVLIPDPKKQYPKLNALGKMWELDDNEQQLTVKSFLESSNGYLVITLDDDSQVIAHKMEGSSRVYVKDKAHKSISQSINLNLFPEDIDEVVKVGDTLPDGTSSVRVSINGKPQVFMLSQSVSGVVTDINEAEKTIEVSLVVVNEVKSYLLFPTKFTKRSTVYLGDFIDDIKYLQQILDWNPGGRVILSEETVYTLTDDTIVIPKNTRLDLNHAATIFEQSGTQLSFQLSEGSQLYNGSVFVTGDGQGGSGAAKSCVSGGNQSTGEGVKGTEVHDLIVNTNRINGNGVMFFGECTKNKVYNIGFPDSDTIGRVVAFEWGGTEAGTGHPNNNEVKNIQGGNLSLAQDDCYVVWMSSTFNMEVTNINAESANGIVGIFTGDKANEYAPDKYKNLIGTGIVVNNPSGKIRRFGARVYGKGSDVAVPVSQRPIINNPSFEGTGLSDLELGIVCEFTDGVTVNDPNISKVGTGIVTGALCKQLIVNGGEVYLCRNNGIRFGNSEGIENCAANYVRLYKNNQAANVGVSSAAAFAIAHSKCVSVRGCKFGLPGEAETQQYSIFVESTARNTALNENHTYSLKAGGVAYVNGLSTAYEMETTGANNTAAPGIALNGGAPIFQINSAGKRYFAYSAATGFPSGDIWKPGDSFDYTSPLPNYHKGGVYTATSGWVNHGATTA